MPGEYLDEVKEHESKLKGSQPSEDGDGKGGLNALRLVSKRCLRVVDAAAGKS